MPSFVAHTQLTVPPDRAMCYARLGRVIIGSPPLALSEPAEDCAETATA